MVVLAVVGLAPFATHLVLAWIAWVALVAGIWDEQFISLEKQVGLFGQIGDSFGVVTSVATTLALVLLFWTFRFQKQEFAEMRRFMERQTAWNVVLQLCEQYREMMAHTTVSINVDDGKGKNVQGKDGLRELISQALAQAQEMDPAAFSAPDVIPYAEKEFNSYEGCFRLLHRILKFIAEEVPEGEQQKYARVPRAMLSNIELEALLINCLTKRGEGMMDFVVKFTIFNNYTPVDLDDETAFELCGEYKVGAFGDNLFLKRMEKRKTSPRQTS